MEWKDGIGLFLIFLSLCGSFYAYFQTRKTTKSRESITEFHELQKTHITESTALRRDLRDMLETANETIERLQLNVARGQELIISLTSEKIDLEKDNKDLLKAFDGLTKQFENLQKQFDEALVREENLETELDRINKTQLERLELEAITTIENERLKNEVCGLKKSIRESIKFYEKRLGEKELQIKTLTTTSEKQGKAIEIMRQILEQNHLTAEVEL